MTELRAWEALENWVNKQREAGRSRQILQKLESEGVLKAMRERGPFPTPYEDEIDVSGSEVSDDEDDGSTNPTLRQVMHETPIDDTLENAQNQEANDLIDLKQFHEVSEETKVFGEARSRRQAKGKSRPKQMTKSTKKTNKKS